MAIFKCKMCGGTIEFEQGASVGVCDSCGTKQTLPRLDDDKKSSLYDRANHFRRNNEFDKAMGIYDQILNEDNTDAEAYWSLVLCKYGIEYVEDPTSHNRIPTVNRAQYTAVFDDENYKAALQYADGYQREIYEKEAKAINEIQMGILAISQQEKPFDVFICYKETDANGKRTPDSVLANDLYHCLTQEGFKVFFAHITLENKLGTAYEPYIFAALNSARVMVVLGTKPEFFQAAWVKNEWSRYLALVKQSNGKKMLIPAYKDMDPYDLPEEFAHLQAQDMAKLGCMQDLIRGIKKLVSPEDTKTVVKEIVQSNGTDIAVLLKRASIFLLDEDWNSANQYCERVLDVDPENAEAYLYKMLASLHVQKESELSKLSEPFFSNNNYKKIMLFGNSELKSRISEYTNLISYDYASRLMDSGMYLTAIPFFEQISGYRDASEKATRCKEKVDEITQEYNTMVAARAQDEKVICDNYAKSQVKAKWYKTFGILSIICAVVVLFICPPFMIYGRDFLYDFNIFAVVENAFSLTHILPIVVGLLLIAAGRLLRKMSVRLPEKSHEKYLAELANLDNKYKPTQDMINNINALKQL